MPSSTHNQINNSDFSKDDFNYTSILIDNNWVLINDIKTRKTIYRFHKNNVLSITKNNIISKGEWHYVNAKFIRITSDDEINIIKIMFRENHLLTLDIDRKSKNLAVFVNESKSDTPLDSQDSIRRFLHSRYINKAKDIIYTHEYYYIEKSKEYGPFTSKELIDKANNNLISSQCFIRETNESNYNKRLRIEDLIKAI